MTPTRAAWLTKPLPQLAILAAVCALVFFFRLGDGGLTDTEGHRVEPALEMLHTGDWLVPRLFGHAYLRKPPAALWAIASSVAIFGEHAQGLNHFAMRAPGAIAASLSALLCWGFARRWFASGPSGSRAALAAGLASVLLPWFWSSARAAEIEPVNNLATLGAVLFTLDVLLWKRPKSLAARTLAGVVLALPLALMLLAKGPAGLPAVAGVVVACAIVRGRARVLVDPSLWLGLTLGVTALAAWWVAVQVRLGGESAIVQSPGAFAFEPGKLGGVALLLPSALLAALPASLALLFVWGPDARAEAAANAHAARRYLLAWTLTLSPLIGLAILTLSGVSNPRYAQPVVVALPLLVGWVVANARTGMVPKRAAIARAMLLGHPFAWPAVLLVAAVAFTYTLEADDRATTGEPAGRALANGIAARFDDDILIVADDAIEARPEVLMALRDELDRLGVGGVEIRWMPGLFDRVQPPPDSIVLARADADSSEPRHTATLARAGVLERFSDVPVEVHKYRLELFLVRETDP